MIACSLIDRQQSSTIETAFLFTTSALYDTALNAALVDGNRVGDRIWMITLVFFLQMSIIYVFPIFF